MNSHMARNQDHRDQDMVKPSLIYGLPNNAQVYVVVREPYDQETVFVVEQTERRRGGGQNSQKLRRWMTNSVANVS